MMPAKSIEIVETMRYLVRCSLVFVAFVVCFICFILLSLLFYVISVFLLSVVLLS